MVGCAEKAKPTRGATLLYWVGIPAVLLTPFTPATHRIVGEAVFAALKPTCHLVNFGRGEVVDEAAMIRALGENRLAGAAPAEIGRASCRERVLLGV